MSGRWKALTALAGVSATFAGAGLFAAGAPASRATAAGTAVCGNHAVTIYVQGETGMPPTKIKGQTKNVKATNVSCKAAFKFLDALYKSGSSGTPEHYKCKSGKAKEPRGYFPQVCTHGSKKIEYGAQGG